MSRDTFIRDLISQLDLEKLSGSQVQAIIDACFTELQRRKAAKRVDAQGRYIDERTHRWRSKNPSKGHTIG